MDPVRQTSSIGHEHRRNVSRKRGRGGGEGGVASGMNVLVVVLVINHKRDWYDGDSYEEAGPKVHTPFGNILHDRFAGFARIVGLHEP